MRKTTVLLFAMMALSCSTPREPGISVPGVGSQAPRIDLPLARGGEFSLDDAVSRGPVVVVFYRGLF